MYSSLVLLSPTWNLDAMAGDPAAMLGDEVALRWENGGTEKRKRILDP